MSRIATHKIYKDIRTLRHFKVLHVDTETDLAITVRLYRQSAQPKRARLSELEEQAQAGRIIPGTEEIDPVPEKERSPAALEYGKVLIAALSPLVELGAVELANRKLWNDYREIGLKVGLTPAGINTVFTKVLQAGLCLSAAYPNWHKCGRLPAVLDGDHCKAKPTRQPNAYPLSLAEIAKIKKGVKEFHKGDTTWEEAYQEFLKKYYPGSFKQVKGLEVILPLPKDKRPSFGQFFRHGRKSLTTTEHLISKHGELAFFQNFAGKPIGQSATALMPGYHADIDWTGSGLCCVRQNQRTSMGILVVYVIIDRFSGMILSIYPTLENASYEEASRATLVCLEDKQALCKRYGIEISPEDWPVYHLPKLLTPDKGELDSWVSTPIVTELGVNIKMARGKMARDKGSVESVNRWIKRMFFRLRGGTKGYKERMEKNPHETAMYDYDQIYGMLLAFAVFYNGRERRRQPLTQAMVAAGIRKTPSARDVWGYGKGRGMIREFDLSTARVYLLPHKEASITDAGISYRSLNYTVSDYNPKSPGGIEANDWLAKAKLKRWKVNLGIDSAAVGHVWLRHAPQGGASLLLRCELAPGQEAFANMTWAQFEGYLNDEKAKNAEHKEGKRQEETAVFYAQMEKIKADAEALTAAAREGMTKAEQTRGIEENRQAEIDQRTAGATDAVPTTTTHELHAYFAPPPAPPTIASAPEGVEAVPEEVTVTQNA